MNGNETSRDSLCLVCETSFLGPNLIEHPYPKGNKTDGPNKIIQCPHCGVARAEPFPTEKEMDELLASMSKEEINNTILNRCAYPSEDDR